MLGGRLLGAAALAAMLLGAGCKGEGAVDEFSRLVDEFCACADEPCRQDVRERVAAFDKKRLEPDRYTDMSEVASKAHRCADREVQVQGAFGKPR